MNGYREAIADKIESLERYTSELMRREYPTLVSTQILEAIARILDAARTNLDETLRRYARVEHGSAPALRIGYRLDLLHRILFTIGNTSRANTPPTALVDSVREVTRRFVPGDIDLMFQPGITSNQYTLTPFEKWVWEALPSTASLVGLPPDEIKHMLPRHIVLLSYPAAEQNNVLLHSIFLHEIGHHVTAERRVVESVLEDHPPAPPITGKRDPHQVIHRWLWEIAADLTALRAVGPAYLFGIHRSMLIGEMRRQYTQTHPPAWLRIKLMLDLLERDGLYAVMPEPVRKMISDWAVEVEADEGAARQEMARADAPLRKAGLEDTAVFEAVEAAVEDVAKEVCAITEEGRYTAAEYSEECGPLVEQLRYHIPLNEWYEKEGEECEVPRIASLAGILNAGWNYVLADLPGVYTNEGAVTPQAQRLHRQRVFGLIAKSIEFAQIQRDVERVSELSPDPE